MTAFLVLCVLLFGLMFVSIFDKLRKKMIEVDGHSLVGMLIMFSMTAWAGALLWGRLQ